MKRLALYLSFVLLLLASLLIPVRTAFAQTATTPTTTAIQNAYGYQHIFEDDDQLYLVQYEFEYALAADTPDWVGQEFLGQFADDTHTFVSIQPWGNYDGTETTKEWWFAIYISADDVDSLDITWGDADNRVAIAGNPALGWTGAIPYDATTAITYSTSTTQEDTQDELEAIFRTFATYYENISSGEDDFIANIGGILKLTDDGEEAFTSTWAAIEIAAPAIFSQASDRPDSDQLIITDSYTGPFTGSIVIYGANWTAQTFTASQTYDASGIKIKAYKVGNPSTVTVSLRATTGNVPTGADLIAATIDDSEFTTDTDGAWETATFATDYTLNANTTYAIVVRATLGDANNYIRWLGAEVGYSFDDPECSPLNEPTTTYETAIAYNTYDEYIYQLGGKTWPGGVDQWTYFARYNVLTNAWTTMGSPVEEGMNGQYIKLLDNPTNGNMYAWQYTRDSDQDQMYTYSTNSWANFAVNETYGGDMPWSLYDATNTELHYLVFDNPNEHFEHSVTTAGAWTNHGGVGFTATTGTQPMHWDELIIGTTHYIFSKNPPGVIKTVYVTYNETTQTFTQVNYGAAWSYYGWAIWYDEDEEVIYGLWSPSAEAYAPQNIHLCTFNTSTRIWTEGPNLGITAYAALPNVYNSGNANWGRYIDGYVYMTGLGCITYGGNYATGSPYFKFPVPQLLGEGYEGQRCTSTDSGASWVANANWDMGFSVISKSGTSNTYPDVPGDWDFGGLPDDFGMSNLWFSSLFWLICTFCMMIASMKVLNSNKAIWSVFILMTPLGYYIGFLAMQIMVGIAIICVMAFIYQFFFRPSGV